MYYEDQEYQHLMACIQYEFGMYGRYPVVRLEETDELVELCAVNRSTFTVQNVGENREGHTREVPLQSILVLQRFGGAVSDCVIDVTFGEFEEDETEE